MFFFFFSSRRRHTRWNCDWSSDVCSSDLNNGGSLVTAQSIQADLKSVGVDVTFRQEDGAVVFESFNLRDFQLGAAGWVADYDDPMTYLNLMKSDTGQQNYGDYKN